MTKNLSPDITDNSILIDNQLRNKIMDLLKQPILAPKFWILRLDSSPIHNWDESKDRVIFDWNFIPDELNNSKGDLQIALAQAKPDATPFRVKSLAKMILNLGKVEPTHYVLGLNSDNVLQIIGKVKSNSAITASGYFEKDPSRKRITIDLSNVKDVHYDINESFQIPLQEELVSLTKTNIRKAKLPFEIETISYMKKGFSHDIFDRKINHGPLFFPDIHGDGSYGWNSRIDEQLEIPQDESDETIVDGIGEVSLFYGTTREKRSNRKGNKLSYGVQLSDLTFGSCTVTIPRNHKQGEIERPRFWKFEFRENPNKHVVVKKVNSLCHEEFIEKLKNDLSRLGKKSALLFIHGYNNSFRDTAKRTAQIAWDIPFNGICGFFSWPSARKTRAYFKDIERADASIPAFQEFVKDLISKTGVDRLHIIAHSMGNRILTIGLNNLTIDPDYSQWAQKIRQVVLAAPDLDQTVFKKNILPKFKDIGNRRTLYASEHDKALAGAEYLRGLPRVGDAGNQLFVSKNVDTIDTSEVRKGMMNHSYAFDTKELLTDLYYLLNMELGPMDRRLRMKNQENIKYWLFPK